MDNVVPRRHMLLKKKSKCQVQNTPPKSGRLRTPGIPKTIHTIVLYDTTPDCQLELSGMTL